MGGSHVRSLPTHLYLVEYMRKTLFIADSVIYKMKAVANNVQLQHLLSLWSVLDDILTVDPFANVMDRYKVPLDEEQTQTLKMAAPHLQLDALLPALKEFMQNYLQVCTTSKSNSKVQILHISSIYALSFFTVRSCS